MLGAQRVLHGTTDISVAVNDFRTGVATFAYTTDQYLYIGSEVPFNNLWIDVAPVNSVAATPTVQMFWGQTWHNAVDLYDETAVAGASLAQSGRLSFELDILKGWDVVQDPANYAPALGITAKIYWMYWARLSWSANLTGTTGLKYIGQKFSTDAELTSYYPDLANTALMSAFGVTDWTQQAFMAAEMIVRDLVSRKIILSRGQVFDWSRFTEASCHKVAELVYRGLGTAYAENRKDAGIAYAAAMNKDFFRVDRNADGRLDPVEKSASQSFMTR